MFARLYISTLGERIVTSREGERVMERTGYSKLACEESASIPHQAYLV